MEIIRPLLIIFAFCGLFFPVFFILRLTFNFDRRFTILQASVILGGLVWLIAELLSGFMAITFMGLASLWGIVSLMALGLLVRVSGGNVKGTILNELQEIKNCLISLPRGLPAIFIGIVFLILVLGLTAIVAAPNSGDSMTYHLSRVMHWEQNRSLAFYPTSIDRQLHLGPLAEMIILNLQILNGNDRLANLVQFFAMLECVIGVSWITKMLNGNSYAQAFAATAVVTLPMGILQSTSTQNDYVAALWLVCFVSLVLKQMKVEERSWGLAFLMGISLGLAFLTKITTLLFGVSFGLWFTYAFYKRVGMIIWKNLVILLGAAIIIVTPHSFRNYDLYGNPLGPMVESSVGDYKYTNDIYGLSVLTSNMIRNTAIHTALPFEYFNRVVEKVILQVHAILDIDINDPGTTWTGTKFQVNYSTNENLAGNPFHLLLIVVSIFFMIRTKQGQLVNYSLCLVAGFFLFSWLLKWQPWHSRLHLPLFILALPLTGLFVSNFLNQRRVNLAMFALLLLSIPYFLQNPLRPLIGADNIFVTNRVNQYFANRPEYFSAYDEQARIIDNLNCTDIGLMAGVDDYEYPIWVMTKAYGRDIHLEHILVENYSGILKTGFDPCAIIVTYPFHEKLISYHNKNFIIFQEATEPSLFVLQYTKQ